MTRVTLLAVQLLYDIIIIKTFSLNDINCDQDGQASAQKERAHAGNDSKSAKCHLCARNNFPTVSSKLYSRRWLWVNLRTVALQRNS